MATDFMTPESLERICLEGPPRIWDGAWRSDPAERLWVLQYARWATLIELLNAHPLFEAPDNGLPITQIACGLWLDGPDSEGRRICREAVRWLHRRRAIRTERKGRRLYFYLVPGPAADATLALVWSWLEERD